MPVLSERDFDKLAARIVDQFLEGDTKLADAAAKIAASSQLNPDQIERLVQSANTQTFLRMMDQRKEAGEEDLMHEFDPIDSRQVIRIVIDNAGVHISGPHDHGDDEGLEGIEGISEENKLPDEMAELRQETEGGEGGVELDEAAAEAAAAEEAAEAAAAAETAQATQGKKEEKEAALRRQRMRKLAGLLEDQYLQHAWAFEEQFEKLAARFKRAHADLSYGVFEKDALAEIEDDAGTNILNLLRETRGLPAMELTAAREKTAALADRHVSNDSPELQMFEGLTKLAHESQKVQRGLEWIKSQCA